MGRLFINFEVEEIFAKIAPSWLWSCLTLFGVKICFFLFVKCSVNFYKHGFPEYIVLLQLAEVLLCFFYWIKFSEQIKEEILFEVETINKTN